MTVSKQPVQVGRMSGWNIEVESGIEPGSRIVTAGVGYLAEGMQVRLMASRSRRSHAPRRRRTRSCPEVEEEVEKAEKQAEPGAPGPAPVDAPVRPEAPAADSES